VGVAVVVDATVVVVELTLDVAAREEATVVLVRLTLEVDEHAAKTVTTPIAGTPNRRHTR
jgi:hypothetical protein